MSFTCVFPRGAHLVFLEFRSDVYNKRDGAVSSFILNKSTRASLGGGGKRPAQCELQETTFPGLSLRKSRQPASCSQIPLPPSHEPRAAFDSAAVSSQICNIDWRTQAQSLSYIRPIRCELFYSNSGYISCKRKLGSHDIKVNMIVGGLLGALTATGPQKAPEIWLALNCICMCRTILYQM